jgi:excisionase family DNA binding protein
MNDPTIGVDPSRARGSGPTDNHRTPSLWTTGELADYLGVPVNTIYTWRKTGQGPPGYRVGRHLRFHRDEVEKWLRTRHDDTHP